MTEEIHKFKEELVELLHKSQDAFERQLSYISAGSLALSIGFIKDIVKNLAAAQYKWCLNLGWILLGVTLLLNCVSHMRAAELHNKTIAEINRGSYHDGLVTRRFKEIGWVNWLTVGTMIAGIAFIIFFIVNNIYNEQFS